MQRSMLALGGLAVLSASFAGTLYILDAFQTTHPLQSFDAIRIEHAKAVKIAIEKYHLSRGTYPWPHKNIDLDSLRNELVGGGFIAQLPVDPYWKNGKINKYRYRSLDGKSYGFLLYMELGPCQTGVGTNATGPWDGFGVTTCGF